MGTSRRLDAAELADAALATALVTSLLAIERVLASAGFFQLLGTVVIASLAARRRTRAVVMATLATAALSVLLGGVGPVSKAVISGLAGWSVGVALRRGWGRAATVGVTLAVAWPLVAGATVAVLAVFGDLRELTLDAARNQWQGMARSLNQIGLDGAAEGGTRLVDWATHRWYIAVPAFEAAIAVVYALVVRSLGRVVLRQVERSLGPARTVPIAATSDVAALPVPVGLGRVEVNRGDTVVHLGQLGERIEAGELVGLVGPNGSGKTSLVRALAGLETASGLDRAGPSGLGRPGGTALIGQRAETQVLGVRVIDDLRWGLPTLDDDVARRALEVVGLDDLAHRPTAGLSGGELQRLAIAAALVRRPALLLSDESTAMLDPAGREAVMAALAAAAREGTAVVHSSHLPDELLEFDRCIRLGPAVTVAPTPTPWSRRAPDRAPVLEAIGVSHVHGHGTPWATPALAPVDLAVGPGQLVLVTGPNGSGKTTLARVLVGLVTPTGGSVTLRGEPLTGPDLRLGIAFQHARLQLLRPTVEAELRAVSGLDHVADAAAAVGVDRAMLGRRIDALSGGEQRRVLLAGILARRCDVVVLDEPLAGLDGAGRAELRSLVDALLSRGSGVVVITHEPDWGTERADLVVELTPA